MIQEQQYDIVSAMIHEARASLAAALLTDGVVSALEPQTLFVAALLADDAVRALEARLRLEWGGQAVYVKKIAIDVEARRQAIRERYNMANRRELQAEFGIGRAQFYQDLRSGDEPGVRYLRRKWTRHTVTSDVQTEE